MKRIQQLFVQVDDVMKNSPVEPDEAAEMGVQQR
jgi:hypothetical protein